MKFKCDTKKMHAKVSAIKAIRGMTHMGLKESKDLVEKEVFSFTPATGLFTTDLDSLLRDLRGAGVEVREVSKTDGSMPLSMLEDALQEAVFERDYSLAEDILAILKKNAE